MADWADRFSAWVNGPQGSATADLLKLVLAGLLTAGAMYVIAHFVIKYW